MSMFFPPQIGTSLTYLGGYLNSFRAWSFSSITKSDRWDAFSTPVSTDVPETCKLADDNNNNDAGNNSIPTETFSLSEESSQLLFQKIVDGDVRVMDKIFSRKPFFQRKISRTTSRKADRQTVLMREIVRQILFTPDNVHFIPSTLADMDIKIVINGQEHPLYPLLDKIKWNKITLSKAELDIYSQNAKNQKYRCTNGTTAKCNDFQKKHLYQDLHEAEKMAIYIKKCCPGNLNDFLRQKVAKHLQTTPYLQEMLTHAAVLSSALNRIPVSVDGYLYRCMSNCKLTNGKHLISDITSKMNEKKPWKELGFTSLSQERLVFNFLPDKDGACLLIFQDMRSNAKDISGIGDFSQERECVAHPNFEYTPWKKYEFVREKEGFEGASCTTHVFFNRTVS